MKLTEEEKEAIEIIKLIINISKKNGRTTAIIYVSDEEKILNLIEKLQKEIKYIRDKNQDLVEENSTKDGDYEELKDNFNEYKANSIPKNKIKKKIEELEKAGTTETRNNKNEVVEQHYFLQDEIDILTELLEEE